MTDKDIIKAFNDYAEKLIADGAKCNEPFEVRDIIAEQQETINRLQAENSNLTSDLTSLKKDLTSVKAEIERLKGDTPIFFAKNIDASLADILRTQKCIILPSTDDSSIELIPSKETIRTEAIKAFAERLKERAKPHYFDNCCFAVSVEEIDNLVKEMTGAQE